MARRVKVEADDVLVYKGKEIESSVLDVIVEPDKRLLWAFVRGESDVEVRAIPYDEEQVIWMTDADVLQEKDVEV